MDEHLKKWANLNGLPLMMLSNRDNNKNPAWRILDL